MTSPSSSPSIDASLCGRTVIFLDIDGVLLPVPRYTFGGGELSEECVQRLVRIVDSLGGSAMVSIVLSSTWRNFPDMIERLNQFFQKSVGDKLPRIAGGTPNGTVIVTQVSYYPDDASEQRLVRDRVDEVERWLHTHLLEHPEGIAGRWIAIDDMKLDVDSRMAGHFLHTDTETGMTDADVERAIEICGTFPNAAATLTNAERALDDPTLKNEEIVILEEQHRRLEARVAALTAELAVARDEVTGLSALRRDNEKELKDNTIRLEDMGYRLALVDFSKKNPCIEAALKLAATKSGKERKELDNRIKSLVNMLRERKELDKRVRAEAKKVRRAQQVK